MVVAFEETVGRMHSLEDIELANLPQAVFVVVKLGRLVPYNLTALVKLASHIHSYSAMLMVEGLVE